MDNFVTLVPSKLEQSVAVNAFAGETLPMASPHLLVEILPFAGMSGIPSLSISSFPPN